MNLMLAAVIAWKMIAPTMDDSLPKCSVHKLFPPNVPTVTLHWQTVLVGPWRIVEDSVTVARGDTVTESYPTIDGYSARIVKLWASRFTVPGHTPVVYLSNGQCPRYIWVIPR